VRGGTKVAGRRAENAQPPFYAEHELSTVPGAYVDRSVRRRIGTPILVVVKDVGDWRRLRGPVRAMVPNLSNRLYVIERYSDSHLP
jgi:hypothetical protein